MSGVLSLGINPSDIKTLRQAYAAMPAIADKKLTAFMRRTTLHLQAESQERTPTAFGTLRSSIISGVTPLSGGIGVVGVVGSSLAYAVPVELGTKPHWAPLQPLVDWVVKKGLAFGQSYAVRTRKRLGGKAATEAQNGEAERIARAIQRSIAKRGTLAVGMFHRTWAAQKAEVQSEFDATVAELAKALPGAKR